MQSWCDVRKAKREGVKLNEAIELQEEGGKERVWGRGREGERGAQRERVGGWERNREMKIRKEREEAIPYSGYILWGGGGGIFMDAAIIVNSR